MAWVSSSPGLWQANKKKGIQYNSDLDMIWFYSLLQISIWGHDGCAVLLRPHSWVLRGSHLPGSTVLVFSISFSPLIPGIRKWKWVTCSLTGQASLLTCGDASVWLSLLFIQHLLSTSCVPGPALGAVETAVNKAGKGSSPVKLVSSSSQREKASQGKGECVSYFLFNYRTDRIHRATVSVFILIALIGNYAERLGISRGSVEKFFQSFTPWLT